MTLPDTLYVIGGLVAVIGLGLVFLVIALFLLRVYVEFVLDFRAALQNGDKGKAAIALAAIGCGLFGVGVLVAALGRAL